MITSAVLKLPPLTTADRGDLGSFFPTVQQPRGAAREPDRRVGVEQTLRRSTRSARGGSGQPASSRGHSSAAPSPLKSGGDCSAPPGTSFTWKRRGFFLFFFSEGFAATDNSPPPPGPPQRTQSGLRLGRAAAAARAAPAPAAGPRPQRGWARARPGRALGIRWEVGQRGGRRARARPRGARHQQEGGRRRARDGRRAEVEPRSPPHPRGTARQHPEAGLAPGTGEPATRGQPSCEPQVGATD